jgi:hypothetical protein
MRSGVEFSFAAILGLTLWGCSSSGGVTGATGTGGRGMPTGAGGSSGTGGAADAGPPEIPLGTPILAPDGTWTSVPFPEGYCRDGTQAHLMVHVNSMSKKIAIYLEGGGACFNDATCKLATFDLPSYVLGQGIFNFTRMDNPIRDWNIFYVPYCTGDVHAGLNPMGVPGPLTGPQSFTGYSNLKLYLSRILATVPDASDELLVGSSAGGFGAGLTAHLVARNVPASVERFTLLDDSGPPMSSQIIVPCLQDEWRKVWGFDTTFLKDCGPSCPTSNDYVDDWIGYLLSKYAKGPFAPKFMAGLISWTGDGVISSFFGFGANHCTATAPVPIGMAQFEAGLLDFRTNVQGATSAFGTFYAAGTSHTSLLMDTSGLVQGTGLLGGLYDTQVGGVKLVDWVTDLINHKQAAHVGP